MIKSISRSTGMAHTDVATVLDTFGNLVKSELKRGARVQMTHFGTFYPRRLRRRKVNFLKRGKDCVIEGFRCAFRPSTDFKKILNEQE